MAAPVLSDEQIALIRKMREWFGGSVAAISAETCMPAESIRNICRYLTRANVEIPEKPLDVDVKQVLERWHELKSIAERDG